MIVDVHSHTWQYPTHFNEDFQQQARRARAGVEVDLTVRYDEYLAGATQVDRTIVFGGKARLSGLWVDDRYVADYVSAHADKLIGFMSLDPTQEGWQQEMRDGRLIRAALPYAEDGSGGIRHHSGFPALTFGRRFADTAARRVLRRD